MKRTLKKTLEQRANHAAGEWVRNINRGLRTVQQVWLAGYRAGRADARKQKKGKQ